MIVHEDALVVSVLPILRPPVPAAAARQAEGTYDLSRVRGTIAAMGTAGHDDQAM